MRREEGIDHLGILFIQQTACGIHQATAWFEQARSSLENRRLLGGKLGYISFRLPPFQVRVAPQGAQTRTRRIDQHTVHLAGEPLDFEVIFVRDALRMHVRQATTLEARRKACKALFRGIKRIQTPGVAHHRAQGQGLAACARAKIDHHLATLGCEQQSQQLAAFVLHLNRAICKELDAL